MLLKIRMEAVECKPHGMCTYIHHGEALAMIVTVFSAFTLLMMVLNWLIHLQKFLILYSCPNQFSDGSIDGGLFLFGLCAESLLERTRQSPAAGWLTFDEWYEDFTSQL